MTNSTLTAAQTLAHFAATLKFESIPSQVVERAKDCMIDTIAAATFGSRFPWSKMATDYAKRYGSGGPCTVIGNPGLKVHAPYAALANGLFSHAFEQDSVRDPGMGAHPGATLLPPLLAACEETNADGKQAIVAFVAATEIMLRIACATHHSPERIGFHAPGLTGAYGATVAAGLVMGLNASQLTHAIGIAGSLSSGLLAFTKSSQGAMVKRLHLGRASESGILAARLASEGYEGPETILEGKFGFLDAYCKKEDIEPALLTAKLGEDWEVMRICMKRYACHINAHTPVQAMRDLMAQHGFKAADVATVHVTGSERLATHHNIREPGDVMQSQYSVPFCVAVALHRDPEDPKSFADGALDDTAIRATCREIESSVWTEPGKGVRSSRVAVTLKDGRTLTRDGNTYKGMPADPLTRDELRRKFMLLCADTDAAAAKDIFERWAKLESQSQVRV